MLPVEQRVHSLDEVNRGLVRELRSPKPAMLPLQSIPAAYCPLSR